MQIISHNGQFSVIITERFEEHPIPVNEMLKKKKQVPTDWRKLKSL